MHPVFTVLVVEDGPLIRMDISYQLQSIGFRVLEAEKADEAIDILVSNPDIQIVFTDVDMPGGWKDSGLQLPSGRDGRRSRF